MRRKEPWFKLWANDYLTDSDVDELSLEAQGLLVRMWCVCSQRGNVPDDAEEIARLTRCKLRDVSQCLSQCKEFFKLDNGLLYSQRMEREKEKSKTARANAEKRYRKETRPPEFANGNANRDANVSARTPAQKAREPESQKVENQTPKSNRPGGEGAALETDTTTASDIDPNMMARGLCERLNLSCQMGPGSVYMAVYDRAQIEKQRGGDLETLCQRMVEAHQSWMKESLKYRWGVAKFFGDGWWEKPETWPRKDSPSQSEKAAIRNQKWKEFMAKEDGDADSRVESNL